VPNAEKLYNKEWWSTTPFRHVHKFRDNGTYNARGVWSWLNASDSLFTQEIEGASDTIIWQIRDVTDTSFWANTKRAKGWMEFKLE
jgi:hypothetical protein